MARLALHQEQHDEAQFSALEHAPAPTRHFVALAELAEAAAVETTPAFAAHGVGIATAEVLPVFATAPVMLHFTEFFQVFQSFR